MSDTMVPMNDTRPGREMCIEMADETVRMHRDSVPDVEGQVDTILSIVSLLVWDLTEAELREYLTLGGINLTDYDEFNIAQDYVSWYVSANTLEVSELFSFSLVDLDTELVERSRWDEEMQARMDKIRSDGIFTREIMAPSL